MEILLPAEQIQQRVAELGQQIAADYQDRRPLTMVGVLTGCLLFLSDLVRRIDIPLRISLLQASSYRGATTTAGELMLDPRLLSDLRGQHVLLVDDILDTGQTLASLTTYLRGKGIASLGTVVLLRKRGRQTVPFEPDYCGFEIPDAFVIGYGLDYNDDYRHLPSIGIYSDQG